MTDNNGVFKYTTSDELFYTKDTLYFIFEDSANRYKGESVQVNTTVG